MSQSTQLIKANAPLPQAIKTSPASLLQTESQCVIATMYNARHDTTVPQGARGGSAEPYGFWGKMMRIVFYPILYPIKVLQEKLGGTPDENTSSTNENGMGNDRLETNFKNNPSCFTTIKSKFAWIYNLSRFFASPGSEGRENNEEKHNSGLQIPGSTNLTPKVSDLPVGSGQHHQNDEGKDNPGLQIPGSTNLYDQFLKALQAASKEGKRDEYLQKHRKEWEDVFKALGAECEHQRENIDSLWQTALQYKTQNQALYEKFNKELNSAEEYEQKLIGQYTEFHNILWPE